jgi:hypothetical protein
MNFLFLTSINLCVIELLEKGGRAKVEREKTRRDQMGVRSNGGGVTQSVQVPSKFLNLDHPVVNGPINYR